MVKVNNRPTTRQLTMKKVTQKIHKEKNSPQKNVLMLSTSENSNCSTACSENSGENSNLSSNFLSQFQENSNNSIYKGLTGEIDISNMSHQDFLKQVRIQAKQLAQSKKNVEKSQDVFVQQYILEKACETCKSFLDDEHMLLCDYCDDAYHSYCLNPPLLKLPSEDEDWMCQDCANQKKKNDEEKEKLKKKRQSQLEEFNIKYKCSGVVKVCYDCEKIIENQSDSCIKCKNTFHSKCFGTKKNQILCKPCQKQIKGEIPSSQPQITQFFKSEKNVKQKQSRKKDEMRLSEPVLKQEKKQKKAKKDTQGVFKLPVPAQDLKTQLKIKKAFIYALKAKQIQFDDDLQFTENCPPEMNNTSNEPNLQKISKKNLEIFTEFKKMTRSGEYAPVIVEEDKMQGFVVRALEDIPERTLLCEYVGQVDTAKNRIFDENDSIMELLKTARSCTTLVIVPQQYGNLARFLSGINNQNKESRKKQNVNSIRMDINGHARVILYAKKKIKKGDLLYYDYNAGGFDEYPTENFV